jgi:hypothetical protein
MIIGCTLPVVGAPASRVGVAGWCKNRGSGQHRRQAPLPRANGARSGSASTEAQLQSAEDQASRRRAEPALVSKRAPGRHADPARRQQFTISAGAGRAAGVRRCSRPRFRSSAVDSTGTLRIHHRLIIGARTGRSAAESARVDHGACDAGPSCSTSRHQPITEVTSSCHQPTDRRALDDGEPALALRQSIAAPLSIRNAAALGADRNASSAGHP